MVRVLGQERALGVLRTALAGGRFHHAWIFSGPAGVGKFTAAMNLARVLLDPELRSSAAASLNSPGAGRADVQRLIDGGTHPDLHVIRKELALYSEDRQLRERKQSTIPIDLLRERVIGGKVGDAVHEAPAYRTAVLGHGKVFIIDEAELMAREAQNAMLKTLEEPPAQTWFLLITSQPEELYATIHSRCQHVRFNRLDMQEMKRWSGDHLQQADAASARWALDYAEGSPGSALLAVQYGFAEWARRLEPMLGDLERGVFPTQMGAALGEMAEEFAAAWVKAHKNASKDSANKDAVRRLISILGMHARAKLARFDGSAKQWTEVIERLAEAERLLDSNVNMKLVLENLVVQWNQVFQTVGAT